MRMIVRPKVDPSQFIGQLQSTGIYHVKLERIVTDPNMKTNFMRVSLRDGRIGMIDMTGVEYSPMVALIEVEDCFKFEGTITRHGVTTSGEVQTFFKKAHIIQNFGSARKPK